MTGLDVLFSDGAEAKEQATSLPALRGVYRISSRCPSAEGGEEVVTLGALRVFAAGPDDDSSGQWAFWMDGGLPPRAKNVLIEAMARLGLAPMHFSAEFEARLRDPSPICLVADTNTLYHGSLLQALQLRKRKATHVALADQALMELQKQREAAYSRKKPVNGAGPASSGPGDVDNVFERWVRTARRATFLSAGGRTLRRIRAAGHIVHVARPPDAMVRYFGGGRHAGEDDLVGTDEDSDLVGSNALRDRLILEAAIRQRVLLPDVPVWLLTDDALLAAQASLEGVSVGFAWLPTALSPELVTSPFFSARTLQLGHVRLQEFIDELLWSSGNLSLQREGDGSGLCSRISSERRGRVLSEIGEPGHALAWSPERVTPWSLAASVPQKAPSPKALLATLVGGRGSSVSKGTSESERYTFQYLQALGWCAENGELTPRGNALAESWIALDYSDADTWASWLEDAGRDVRRLRPLAAALAELRTSGTATDAELARRLGASARTVGAQLLLASAFGLAVRLGTKGREAGDWTVASSEAAVLEGIRTSLERAPAGVSAVNVGKLFGFLQRPEVPAMPFHVFRRALVQLEKRNRIVFSGSVPDADNSITISVLIPIGKDERVALQPVSLGSGGYIVAGRSAKVVQLQEVPT